MKNSLRGLFVAAIVVGILLIYFSPPMGIILIVTGFGLLLKKPLARLISGDIAINNFGRKCGWGSFLIFVIVYALTAIFPKSTNSLGLLYLLLALIGLVAAIVSLARKDRAVAPACMGLVLNGMYLLLVSGSC
jgi:hypothetical protein